MYVGVLVPGSLHGRSGGYLYDRTLVGFLREQGATVSVVSIPGTGSYVSRMLVNGSASLRRRLERSSFDVLLQDELAHPSLPLVNRSLRRRVGYPIVTIVHHLRSREPRSGIDRRISRAAERLYLDSVDAFVFNSETTRRDVADLVDPRPGLIAHPGSDRFDPDVDGATIDDRAHRDPLQLLFVGAVTPRKGVCDLVAGLARLDAEWRLAIVGDETVDPDYVDRVRRFVETNDLASSVDITGELPAAALRRRLCRSHMLVVPSRYEGFGIVYGEAMGFGVVPLATTAGAGPELITPGIDGLLVPPGDPAAIAAAIRPVARDRDRLASLGRGARRRYASLPTWEDSCRRIHSFLREVAE